MGDVSLQLPCTAEYGVRKFSLWNGDLGLAIYLWHCINKSAVLPTMDEF